MLAAHEIAERLRRLTGLPRPMWLTGGVAVDFLVGRWTRAHKDLDLVAFSTDREVLHAELRERDITLINEGTWTTRWIPAFLRRVQTSRLAGRRPRRFFSR